MSILKTKLALVFAMGFASQAYAVPVPSFSGTYDEATGVEAGGDYDNIGGGSDVGDFSLVAGVNTFEGSIFTPDDSSDVFNIVIGPNQTLVGATLVFASNADAFNPFFGFPSPTWGLYESSVTPVIFEFKVPDSNGQYSPFTSTQTFTRGAGIYNMVIGNGTFGMYDGSPVDYTMTFTVEETQQPAIPLPASLPLMLGGVGVLAGLRRRAKR